MQSDFEFIQHVIDEADMSDEDKSFIKTAIWTSGEIAEITSSTQYKAYSKIEAELRRRLPDRSSPDFELAFVEWARSRDRILALTYGEKIAEWEEQQEDNSLDEP
jgi:hypothetical protein